MAFKKGEACWSCPKSDFNPISGELMCLVKGGTYPKACPYISQQRDNVIEFDSYPKLTNADEWHNKAS